ncbi:hypothetical protein QWZ10_02565 [Paracoccus cavernae]|uniref:Uncharacterized protein n=2 Tax=Paracoccus cavernae TaxID=1571207 RepID=A0ABT8D4X8_9RHOB|nr:hypothetical protein [Paracoccus cavernae]
MRSAMGRQAAVEGWAVELFQIAKRLGPPPGKYIVRQLKDDAEAARRRRVVVSENTVAGIATEAERTWLDAYEADLAEILEIQLMADEAAA